MPEPVGGIGVTRAAKVRAAVTTGSGGRDDVAVADAVPGRADAAAGASQDSQDADGRQPRRAHLRQRGGALVARGDRAHPPCRQ